MIRHELVNEWLSDVASDSITIDVDVNVEAQKNMWSFTLPPALATTLTIEDIVGFINTIIESRQTQIRHEMLPRMILYVWYDEMARQLRLSMISKRNGFKLPFKCKLNTSSSIDQIACSFLASARNHAISWSELEVEHHDSSKNMSIEKDIQSGNILSNTLDVFTIELRSHEVA